MELLQQEAVISQTAVADIQKSIHLKLILAGAE